MSKRILKEGKINLYTSEKVGVDNSKKKQSLGSKKTEVTVEEKTKK